jgi:hypothetical protein
MEQQVTIMDRVQMLCGNLEQMNLEEMLERMKKK